MMGRKKFNMGGLPDVRVIQTASKLSRIVLPGLLALCVFAAAGCGGGSSSGGGGTTTVATPTFSVLTGTYTMAQSVTLLDTTSGAVIYYTIDGTMPTRNSHLYSAAITVDATETLEAFAVVPGDTDSAAATAAYTFNQAQAATPGFSVVQGTYTSAQPVTLTDGTAGASIYYTTDGTTPTYFSTKFGTTPIAVNSTETIKAIAEASGFNNSNVAMAAYTINIPTTPPTITASDTGNGAQNGAQVVTLSAPAGTIYYTLDGSTPTASSQQYLAPFLVDTNLTVNAIAVVGSSASSPATQAFTTTAVPSGTVAWSEEFSNTTGSNALPNSLIWTYDTGTDCCGNNEQETYCAAGSSVSPCNPSSPNAYADTNGILNIVAQNPSSGVYTSARLKTEGLFSFQYGRLEARIQVPESQAMWPAFWMLGNDITTVSWPACGEIDVMEHIDGSNPGNEGYDWTQGSIHGTSMNNDNQYPSSAATSFSAATWHVYGMIWKQGQIQFYMDTPTNIYGTYTPSTQTGTWPFDSGPEFIILNLAVGGSWPGDVDGTTVFPSTMQVDYVRIYAN